MILTYTLQIKPYIIYLLPNPHTLLINSQLPIKGALALHLTRQPRLRYLKPRLDSSQIRK